MMAAALSFQGCATIPEACRNVTGVSPRVVERAGRPVVIGYDYADEASRIGHLHCLAEQGVQNAQLELALKYETGDGTPRDLQRAARLYERAAVTIPRSMTIYSPPVRLGGTGTVLFLDNPNARTGSAEAQYRLGRMLVEGRGVARDGRRGTAMIGEAARQGHREAQRWIRENPDE